MKRITAIGLALTVLCVASVRAAELASGPQPGDTLGPYEVTKVAGAPEDGVPVGEELCYRCKMGNRPVIMIFSRNADSSLANLVKRVDSVVAQNKTDHNMASFVSLIGADSDALATAGKKVADESKAENVAFVVPKDQPNGPASYDINPAAETTVLIYVKGTVAANHALPAGGLDDAAIDSIVADTAKILN